LLGLCPFETAWRHRAFSLLLENGAVRCHQINRVLAMDHLAGLSLIAKPALKSDAARRPRSLK